VQESKLGTTTFTGPITAGDVLNTTGTSAGTVANVGYVEMVQTVSVTQSATAAATAICIPASSQIIGITAYVTTAFTGASAGLNVGTSATSTELVSAANFLMTTSNTVVSATTLTSGQMTAWIDVGNTDVIVYVKAANAASGSTGAAYLTVRYAQAINLTP
jgi:hypothetical protein